MQDNQLIGQGVPIGPLLWHLSRLLHRTILDETGLSSTYDFTLQLPSETSPEFSEPATSAAMEQQLGLKLEPQELPMEVLVIDHVEKPLEN